MRFAIFSDIHGNIEAFRKVLEDISAQNTDCAYFLGDAISYGPNSDACVQLLRETGTPCILGNHELALVKPEALSYFNDPTRKHFETVKKEISPQSLEYISTWPKTRVEHGMILVHGIPPKSITGYLFELDENRLKSIILSMAPRIAFVGHTHELQIITCKNSQVLHKRVASGKHKLDGDAFIVNVGSVGQPRDMDNRAKYIIFDQEAGLIEVRYVEYDVEKTVRDILDKGYPEHYAWRLR